MAPDTNSWCSLGFAEPSAVYTSATQQARHLTEGWMAEHGFCPACPADRLPPLPNNTRVGDFRCAACGEEYELKSGQGAVAGVLPTGAWGAMKQRLAAANNPSLFVMGYDRAAHRVSELIVVPRHFFTEAIIRPRAPCRIRGMRPAAGTSFSRMVQPCQPARRAAGPSGARGRTIASVKKWRGTTISSLTRCAARS